jgi:hypothetical protein
MLSDQKDLLAIFNTHGVRYLIVGPHAVGVHSEPRGTKDLDVLIEASSDNAGKVCSSCCIRCAAGGDVRSRFQR